MKFKRLLFLIPAAVMVFIFLFSAQNGKESLELSNGLLYNIISNICRFFNLKNIDIDVLTQAFSTLIRKGAHFSVYAFLGLSLYISFYYNKVFDALKKVFITSQTISVVYAITDEIHQNFVPGRDGNALDVLLDSFGALVGIAIIYIILQYCKNKLT